MGIYKYTGEQIFEARNSSGQPIDIAYGHSGEEVFRRDASWTLKIMSYNIQKWSGINSQPAMQNAIVAKYTPDIIALQELGTSQTLPSIAVNMLADYNYINQSIHKNLIGIASKLQLTDITVADYAHQDPEDISRYAETRAYIKGYINIHGSTVCIINTHLCYLTTSVKWQQMMELLSIAENEDMCIICGDFNSGEIDALSDDYIEMFKPFVDAGYNLANCSPEAGFTKTYSSLTTASSLSDLQTSPDSIIVSPNLTITNVVFDTTKFQYLNGSVIDHIPVVCEVSYSPNSN